MYFSYDQVTLILEYIPSVNGWSEIAILIFSHLGLWIYIREEDGWSWKHCAASQWQLQLRLESFDLRTPHQIFIHISRNRHHASESHQFVRRVHEHRQYRFPLLSPKCSLYFSC
jgi:hypothetical protein